MNGLKRKILVGLMIFLAGTALVYAATLNKDLRQKLESIRMASAVYDRHGQLVGNLYHYQRIWAPIQKIPRHLQQAVIAIEDARFYQHNGIDLRGMARALWRNTFSSGTMEGGSTITQQLAKIALLTADRTWSRKVQDITYALQIEQTYTKKEILELYLNSIYLAHGNVGVEAASRYYFGKPAAKLLLEESALLAGIIQSPENDSPVKHPAVAKKRRNIVLREMLEQHYISAAQYKKAVSSEVKLAPRNQTAITGNYFLDYVKSYLIKNEGFTEDQLRFGGYKIYTTLDLSCQRLAEQAMLGIPKIVKAKVQPQGAMVTLDPRNGEILAMVGGRSYASTQYNRAIRTHRQPGSAIKPFVYATALEKGYTAASIFEDKPLAIPLLNGTVWQPVNYDQVFRGPITLREALRNSVNTVAVQLVQAVGVNATVETIERMGITSLVKTGTANDLNLAPMALGGLTRGVTPLELAAAYTSFANQGIYAQPMAVRKVLDRHGNHLKSFKPVNRPTLTPQTAYIMTMLLQDVVEKGTGYRAKLTDRPVAGKTGTTSDYSDAWFVGYTPTLLTAVWIGNDQGQPMKYPEMNIGSATAAEIWGGYMNRITVNRPVQEFVEPPGILWADVSKQTGEAVPGWYIGERYKEVFNENYIPESGAFKVWRWLFHQKKTTEKNPNHPVNQEEP